MTDTEDVVLKHFKELYHGLAYSEHAAAVLTLAWVLQKSALAEGELTLNVNVGARPKGAQKEKAKNEDTKHARRIKTSKH